MRSSKSCTGRRSPSMRQCSKYRAACIKPASGLSCKASHQERYRLDAIALLRTCIWLSVNAKIGLLNTWARGKSWRGVTKTVKSAIRSSISKVLSKPPSLELSNAKSASRRARSNCGRYLRRFTNSKKSLSLALRQTSLPLMRSSTGRVSMRCAINALTCCPST